MGNAEKLELIENFNRILQKLRDLNDRQIASGVPLSEAQESSLDKVMADLREVAKELRIVVEKK
jgi:hypothetical protein